MPGLAAKSRMVARNHQSPGLPQLNPIPRTRRVPRPIRPADLIRNLHRRGPRRAIVLTPRDPHRADAFAVFDHLLGDLAAVACHQQNDVTGRLIHHGRGIADRVVAKIRNSLHRLPCLAAIETAAKQQVDIARIARTATPPFGKRQQICCEQIEITASMERIGEAETTILGIMAPDLPVVLWVRGACWLTSEGFARLFPLAQKVVIDSSRCGGEEPFDVIRRLEPKVKLLGDLAWTRLTSLREIIAHTFEDANILGQMKSVGKIVVEYTAHSAAASYLAGWLSDAASPNVQVEVRQKQGEFDTLQLTGPNLDIHIELGPTALFRINGTEHRAMLPVPTEVSTMREELSILRKDRVFEAALARAEKL